MSDYEQAKAKVIGLMKKGVLNKEQATKILTVYKTAIAKGQNVTIELVLQKMGVGVAGGKSAKPAKKKAPATPKKKILSAGDISENKYAQRRRKANKKPMIIGMVSLTVLGVVAFFLFQSAQNTKDEHYRAKAKAKQDEIDRKAREKAALNEPSTPEGGSEESTEGGTDESGESPEE